MKRILLFIVLVSFFVNLSAMAAEKKKTISATASDKVYAVEKNQAEINIGTGEDLVKTKEKRRLLELWSVSFSRSSLSYRLPSLLGGTPHFSPVLLGVNVAKKMQNQFFLYTHGYWEIGGEWQSFKRESNFNSGVTYSQNLNLYQVNLYQNFNIASAFKHKLYFSVGLGVAPLFLTTDQSVLGNSHSELGYLGMVKMNVIHPIKKSLELDLVLKSGWGNTGDHDLFLATIGLGVNFE